MSNYISILLVEDDINLQKELKLFLEDIVESVDTTDNVEDALKLYKKSFYDIIITDIKLPHKNGLFLVKKIKEQRAEQIVIVMSAHQDVEYFLKSIELQIFSFLVKPFSSEELMKTLFKAINKVSKKKFDKKEKIFLYDNITYDLNNRYLFIDDALIMLTQKEEELLYLLAKNIDGHISEEQIRQDIWGKDFVADSTIRVLVKRLRDKLSYNDAIINLKGRGYKLVKKLD